MSVQQNFTQPLRTYSDMSDEDFQAILRTSRVMRAEAFSAFVHTIGRFIARPFRRDEDQAAGKVAHLAR